MSDDKKVALVTGSTAGIGLSCAQALAKRGVNVIVSGSRSVAAVGDILDDLKKYGVRVDYVSADLGDLSGVERLWTEVTELYPDGIDILVNNAGLVEGGSLESLTDEKWDRLIAVNITAPFGLTKRCLPAMKKKGWGRIINVSSINALIAHLNTAAYTATKHALNGLTKGVALENAAHGITCNAVCPGFVITPMLEAYAATQAAVSGVTQEQFLSDMEKSVPTKKIIKPEHVAELVEFLCLSNASSQMTGAAYVIDGGYTAQ